MNRRPALIATLVMVVTMATSTTAQPGRRTIYASALDASGTPVPTLNPEDVVVREDRATREVLDVWPAAEPMEIALLVDNSQASQPYISNYREALPAFINALGADESGARHHVALITLADRPTITTDYTADLQAVVKGTQRLFPMPGSGTYLLDAIVETSQGISKRSAARPVIVAITTEGPELSDRAYQAVLEPLRSAGAALYVIVVGRPLNNDTERSVALGMGTKDSGGSYDNLLTGTSLTPRLKKLAAELTHQFKVTYSRPQSLIPPDQVSIGAARPGLTVRGAVAREFQERR